MAERSRPRGARDFWRAPGAYMDHTTLSVLLADLAGIAVQDVSVGTTLERLVSRITVAAPRTRVRVVLADRGHHRLLAAGNVAGTGANHQRAFELRANDDLLGAMWLTPLPADDQEVARWQLVADVLAAYLYNATARAAAKDVIAALSVRALHDPVTGAPNRWLLRDRLEQAVARAARGESLVAVLFLDVDGMKAVNDTYGHDIGDAFLRALVDRLRRVVRPGDTFARLGGDEFVVICEGLTTTGQAEEVADRMLAAAREPFIVAGRAICAGISIGLAFGARGNSDADDLLSRADAAMYVVKRGGGGQRETAPALAIA